MKLARRRGRQLQQLVGRRLATGLETGVLRLELGIANDANNREVIEGQEFFRVFAFATEQRFALVTPCLQVIGVGAVLDKTDDFLVCGDMMAADDSSRQRSVLALDGKRFSFQRRTLR